MPRKTEWRQFPGWWDGIPFLVVFGPDQTVTTELALWPSSYAAAVDDEELEVLELAGRLASLKTTRKH